MQAIPPEGPRKQAGFTLVELIVVITIIAILAALLAPVVSTYIKQATDATGNANARAVYAAAAAFAASQLAEGELPYDFALLEAGKALNPLTPYLGDYQGYATATFHKTTGAVESVTWQAKADQDATSYTYPPTD